jgi:hypothetical protein
MDEKTCLKIIKALADASRLRLLNSIVRNPQYVEELSERMGLSASTVSFHLKKLGEAGLVTKSRDQYYAVYEADERVLDATLRELIAFENVESGREESRIRNYREKALKPFFKGNRLIRLPAQHKKKRLVLEEFARRFEPGRNYSEKDVNAIIIETFDDYCTVRRLMIDEGLMGRKDNVYWRTADAASSDGGDAPKEAAASPNRETTKGREKQQSCKGGKKMKTRAELKKEYKDNVIEMGIVAIRNLRNGRMWLGPSPNPESTLRRHRFELSLGSSWHWDIQKDWKEFGEEAFSFEILDTFKPDPAKDKAEELATLEAVWREKLADDLVNEYK